MNLMASQTACRLHNYILHYLFYYNVDLLVLMISVREIISILELLNIPKSRD